MSLKSTSCLRFSVGKKVSQARSIRPLVSAGIRLPNGIV